MTYTGVDIGGTRIKAGLVSASGRLLKMEMIPMREIHNYRDFVNKVGALVRHLGPSKALGMGLPGRVDAERGQHVWLHGKLEWLQKHYVARDFRKATGRPCFVDNDANVVILGEKHFGSARKFKDFIGFTVGTGIGGAVFIAGHLVRGAHFATGHFGYMSQRSDGDSHESGNRGAVELYASHKELVKLAGRGRSLPHDFGLKDIVRNPRYRKLKNMFFEELAVMTANLIFAFDPEAVIVGGGAIQNPGFMKELDARVRRRIHFLKGPQIKILPARLGDAAGIFGGAALAAEGMSRGLA